MPVERLGNRKLLACSKIVKREGISSVTGIRPRSVLNILNGQIRNCKTSSVASYDRESDRLELVKLRSADSLGDQQATEAGLRCCVCVCVVYSYSCSAICDRSGSVGDRVCCIAVCLQLCGQSCLCYFIRCSFRNVADNNTLSVLNTEALCYVCSKVNICCCCACYGY